MSVANILFNPRINHRMSNSEILFNHRINNRYDTDLEINRIMHNSNKTEFINNLKLAYKEYETKFRRYIDIADSNILVLDYNPETKKFLFGPIHFAGSNTKYFPN